MASDSPAMAVNGSYATPAYDMADQTYDPTRTAATNPAEYSAADASANTTSGNGTGAGNADIPKDEVGWYFVEQYYTTLSKSPEKLFLFYNKSSQFVSGTEAEKAPVCVGQKAINERIKELDIQDCKVRVTNVDSQGSQSNIVIQVIGEISNKSAPQRKFTQTFVLAEQANGYFVLNDIFRYLLDEEEEEEFVPQESEPVETQTETATQLEEPVPATNEVQNAGVEAEEPEEPSAEESQAVALDEADIPSTAEVVPAEEAPAAAVTTIEAPTAEAPAEEVMPEEQAKEVQPAAAAPTTATAQPVTEPAPKPAAPTSWAGLLRSNAAAAAAAAPAVPATATAASASSAPGSGTKSTPTPTVQTQATSTPTAPAASSTPPQDTDPVGTPQSSGSEWQTAGQEHGKKPRTQQGAQTPAENSRAYIKNVNDTIDIASLQAALAKIADISYIDINRQKNCAFVDFSTPAGYRAAVAANPYEVSGERLYVEERKIRQGGNFPGGPGGRGNAMRGTPRPGSQGQGRGTYNNNNNNNKDGGRGGNYGGRGRGGNVGARGRGGVSQTA